MPKTLRILVVVAILELTPVEIASQSSMGSILGTITDVSGAVVPQAAVSVINKDTNALRRVLSNDRGDYVLPLLRPGIYSVSARLSGFKAFHAPVIRLHVNERVRVDVVLQPGEITETITLEAQIPLLQRDSSNLGGIIDRQNVIGLPLNGRNFFQLTYLVPGAVPGAQGSQNATQGGAVSVFGMREQSNQFLLDGVDNSSALINQVAVPPPIDSVQEFKVQSGIYAAEFGTHAGAQINFVTKSGSNLLHGSAYSFHRNAALDAKNFFDPPDRDIPKFIRNQYGFSVGGPVARDRTFFFGNYEGLRERKAITRLATVPPSEFLQGDFSSLLPDTEIINPETWAPFPGNIIPPEAMDPIGSAIAGFFPEPNTDQPGGNLVSQPVGETHIDQFVIRVDHEIGPRNSIFGRYSLFNEDRFNPFDPLIDPTNIPGFGSFTVNRGQNLGIGWRHSWKPNLMNELRFGYNRLRAGLFQENIGNDISSRLGIQGLSTEPTEVGFPATVVVGYDSLSEPFAYPGDRVDATYHVVEALSWAKGSHFFKFGADMRQINEDVISATARRGSFNYRGDFLGDPVAELLLGKPWLVAASFGNTQADFNNWSYGIYFQDDFKASNQLTINYGVRYEYYQPPVEVAGRASQPDLTAAEARFTACGSEGIPRGCYFGDKNNFAPRLGVAWSPLSSGRMVVRSGYGVFYDSALHMTVFNLWLNPPDDVRVHFFPPSLARPFEGGQGFASFQRFVEQKLPLPYVQQWSLSTQYSLQDSLLLEAGYAGTKGTKLLGRYNPNQPRPGGQLVQGVLRELPRPFPAYSNLNSTNGGGASIYHGFWLRAQRRFVDGFSFNASYTFSKAIDDGSSQIGSAASESWPQDSYNRRAERGLSDFDLRHRFVASYLWEVPVGRGKKFLGELPGPLDALIGGWHSSGIVTFHSARPFTAVVGNTDDSKTFNGTPGTGEDRPNLVGNPHLDSPDPSLWINTAAFQRTCDFSQDSSVDTCPGGTFGNAGRNILRGPGFASVDLALMKQWTWSESTLQFRAEFFNLLNHPNFDLPQGDFMDRTAFGRVQSARDSRQIQFGLRLEF